MRIGDCISGLIAALLVVVTTGGPASAASSPSVTEQVLYNFCAQLGCADGSNPYAGPIMDAAGNLYGTTYQTGGSLGGTVFQLVPTGTGWTETVLYRFCQQSGCNDGTNPRGGLIMDGSGNLYGTTGGSSGTVFQLAPTGTAWNHTVLYKFCSQTNCVDGAAPHAGLVMDEAGNLYGTTNNGGDFHSNAGVIFSLTPTGSGWTETVLYSFCLQSGCADGANPHAGLIMDRAGNLYGTTYYGGGRGSGVVFQLTPTTAGWTETVLYSFCAQSGCADGAYPEAGLLMDDAGNLYGTTVSGGSQGKGAVFKLVATSTGWTETVLYSFCAQSGCADGSNPYAGLIMDAAGNIYGTTTNGGSQGKGAVFKLTATTTSWSEKVLYNFCSQGGSGCTDGSNPSLGDLLLDAGGALYGTTTYGGQFNSTACFHGCGVVFRLTETGYDALSVSVVGIAGGRVTSSPSGIDCGSTCSASFAAGTQVILTASPVSTWGFTGWGGACGGLGSCTLTMDADKSVSASFTTLFGTVAPPLATSPPDDLTLPPPIIPPVPQ